MTIEVELYLNVHRSLVTRLSYPDCLNVGNRYSETKYH